MAACEHHVNQRHLATCCLVGLLLIINWATLVSCQEQLSIESRETKESAASENELAEAIKYLEKLEKLDKYWSEVARPRFGRSQFKQASKQPMYEVSNEYPKPSRASMPYFDKFGARIYPIYYQHD